MKKHKIFLPIIFITLSTFSYSQGNFKLGGNTNAATDDITATGNNYLGSQSTFDIPILIGTNGTQRMYIGNSISNGFIGIGDNFSTPQYLLHINGINNGTGYLFQTTGSDNTVNRWVMSAENTYAERFYIENPGGGVNTTYDAELGTSRDGEINFTTHRDYSSTPLLKSVSIQGGNGGSVHGQLALGNQLPVDFDAKARLHLHKTYDPSVNTPGGNFVLFTSDYTIGGSTPTANSGFQLGLRNFTGTGGNPNTADAVIRMWEDQPIRVFTNGEQRMVITSNDGTSSEGYIYMGNNTPNPTSRLDIDGDLRIRDVQVETPDALFVGVKHSSGNSQDLDVRRLDFTGNSSQVLLGNGTWGASPMNAHNGTSLSTISNGYVAFGQDLNEPGDPGMLLNHREVPMNDYNIMFTDDGATTYGTNEIGVGTSNPTAKFHVMLNSNINASVVTYGGRIDNESTSASAKGLYVNMQNHEDLSYGVEADIDATTNTSSLNQGFRTYVEGGSVNEGLHVWVKDGTTGNTGVYALATSSNTGANQTIGVIGYAYDGGNANKGGDFRGYSQFGNPLNNYGVYTITGGTATNSYGIYASAAGGTATNYAGYFNGNVYISGSYGPSDQNLKSNIQDLTNAMSIIEQLQPKTFEFNQSAYPSMNLDGGNQFGLIAQDVQSILPELISNNTHPAVFDSLGNIISPEVNFLGLEYTQLVPILIAGMKEQQSDLDTKDSLITDLNDRLTNLENCLSNILPALCQANARFSEENSEEEQEAIRSMIDVRLSDGKNIVLNQNVPNPFAEKTVITYSIPESVGKAQIHFYNSQGKLINTVEIIDRGQGQLNVFADDLSSGIYTYTLVADGQIVSTKRMMKQ